MLNRGEPEAAEAEAKRGTAARASRPRRGASLRFGLRDIGATPKTRSAMQRSKSHSAFERAKRIIPGGVNSPARAYGASAASRCSLHGAKAPTSLTSMGTNTSTTSAPGGR